MSGRGPHRLVLDVLELAGGSSATIKVTATELFESYWEVQVTDAGSFTPGRKVRGEQSGLHVTVIGTRTASGDTYLQYTGTQAAFISGETVTEQGVKTTDSPNSAASAVIAGKPSEVLIEGDMVSDTTAVSEDAVVDISGADRNDPAPYRARRLRLKYAITGNPTSASFIVRVA